jgi:hypothetical protein
MKTTSGVLMLAVILSWVIGTALTIHGLILAFSASVLLGIAALILEPSPAVISLVYIFTGTNVPAKLMAWLNLPV